MASAAEQIIKNIPIPRMVKIRQKFEHRALADVAAEVRKELSHDKIMSSIKPGMSIAITAGSRGVANIALIIREIVAVCHEAGAKPFVIPAMGSHGGASAEGQLEILSGYNVVEEYIGCPVKATMEVTKIGQFSDEDPILIDKYAAEADGIIVVGRIKPHTLFHDRVESGVCKMMAIGLGKQRGAEECHKMGPGMLAHNVQKYGYGILENSNIIFGVGIVEDAYDDTALIHAFARDEIHDDEPKYLEIAKSYMPRIMFDACDLMIVDEVGKNISGDGMDPNITGRYIVPIKGKPDVQRMVVLDIAEESHGNGNGIGFADMTTQRAADKFDREKTYPNGLTSQIMDLTRIPPVFRNDKLCIQAALKTVFGIRDYSAAKVVRIKNTLHVAEFEISESLLEEAKANPNIEIISEPYDLPFDENGNLF